MPYVCPQCGERDRFHADDASCVRTYREYGIVQISGRDGTWDDFEERDAEDCDTRDMEFADVRCSNCNAHAEYCDTEAEAEAILGEHPIPPRHLEEHCFSVGRETTLNY